MQERTNHNLEESVNTFVQKVNKASQRTALQQRVDKNPLDDEELTLTPEALQELQTALEQLRVAEEELQAQNEELALARAEVESQRQRYQDLFEFAPDGYLVTDDVGTIWEANRVAAKMLNVSQQFLTAKPLLAFIAFTERRIFRTKLLQLQQLNNLQEWEVNICPRNGTTFNAALTVSTVCDWEGNILGYRWLLRDITARKQAEEKIRNIQLQNLQLQESARLKSHFLAIMSHELRSPMNAIIGFSQLLLRNSQNEQLAESQQNMVERIFNSGKHLLTLIDDILDFSKIEAGSFELQLEEFNLLELVTTTTEELRCLADQKNLALQINLNLYNPYIVNDITRLKQVLVNLISNAIKFTDSGSVEVNINELPSERIAIAIKDTGIGIAEDDLGHIFEEFRQVNQTITRKHGGTGLGLAIVDRLVRMMQGTITLESKLNEGSTFRVELPRKVRS